MKQNYFIMFFLTLCAQLLICNYFHISAYISLSILPVAILCLPTKIGAAGTMLIAFATGLGTDFLAEGLIGLNAAALVPVAACKRFICDSVFGKELILLRIEPKNSRFIKNHTIFHSFLIPRNAKVWY